MMLPLWDGLVKTTHFDAEMAMLADRHYSRRTVGARQFLYSGRKLVLRDTAGDVLFGWLWPHDNMRMDKQTGYCCAIFRNESSRRSSEIILEAEAAAFSKWGPRRCFTYVQPGKVRSSNPGYCFQKAGWKKMGVSKAGLVLLTKEPPLTDAELEADAIGSHAAAMQEIGRRVQTGEALPALHAHLFSQRRRGGS